MPKNELVTRRRNEAGCKLGTYLGTKRGETGAIRRYAAKQTKVAPFLSCGY
jgi:hypothetical protein